MDPGPAVFLVVRLSPQEEAPYVPVANLPAGNPHPQTATGVVTRTIRSTAVSRAVKALYDDRCQVCDTRLEAPGGTIAEGAHIRALGKPHRGPDVPDNVLCLCPNHHALLDDGGIYIGDDLKVRNHAGDVIAMLDTTSKQSIGLEHLTYHRELWAH